MNQDSQPPKGQKTKHEKCPNCGQNSLVDDTFSCQWCGWPLLAKARTRVGWKRTLLGWLLRMLATFVLISAAYAYQGTWKYIGHQTLATIHNSPTWLFLLFFLAVLLLQVSSLLLGITWSPWNKTNWLGMISFAIAFPIIVATVIIYIAHTIQATTAAPLNSTPQIPSYNFDLATISATLGGLIMVGGFIDNNKGRESKKPNELITIGKWFLIASVFSALVSLFMPAMATENTATPGYTVLFFAVAVAILLSAFSFAWAVCLLLPKLWKLDR